MQYPTYSPGALRFLAVFSSQEITAGLSLLDNKVMNAIHTYLNGIPESEFQTTFHEKWIERMNFPIQVEGRYFKKECLPESDSD